ncbi:hypothetical protein ZIOFF_010337 [Zingiber officinale]|uniref:FHA domain-containing protein n=1 Tax=Zingiber officinale TaxID=94328 RepID=A0A8J5HZL8_ZINOF|nr:hypothetical protein ZIOFF_010337 [Zingiber officinale]
MAVESPGDAGNKVKASVASGPPVPRPAATPEDEIRAVARKFSDQPVQNPDRGVWAVLTAISKNARQRQQGMNILLSGDEHSLGRCVEDPRYQISTMAVSGSHCKIFRDKVAVGDAEVDPNTSVPVFLKDTSTNGTYLNWTRLRKHSPQTRLQHGDIIAFVAPPHNENSYAFVYREVHRPSFLANGSTLKRKSDELDVDSKRFKGIGIGAPDGPISLDDVRSLQRSNTELRQQLESHVLTIETLKGQSRSQMAHHENELKDLKEIVSKGFHDQIEELKCALNEKHEEINSLSTVSAELRSSMKDLKERLSASVQSRIDADEIIQSQKATISELEARLDEERNQRREEREQAAADLNSAIKRIQLEAQEEIKRQADNYLRQHREQQEVISKLEESEKESRLLVETLRVKLGDARENLVTSEKKVRQLEIQVKDEQLVSMNSQKKSESLEAELKRLRKDIESEKVAREEAWAKVSALELEIAAAIRDLSIEKQRFQGARERIILRETQLRAFYSTTEEISALFAKQQEQLKAMQRTLEDEEHYENSFIETDPVEPNVQDTNDASCSEDDDVSTTEKHDCSLGVSMAVAPEGDPTDTERVMETESQVEDVAAAALLLCSDGLAAGSQSNQRFQADGDAQGGESMSDAETQSSNNSDANRDIGQSNHDGNDDTRNLEETISVAHPFLSLPTMSIGSTSPITGMAVLVNVDVNIEIDVGVNVEVCVDIEVNVSVKVDVNIDVDVNEVQTSGELRLTDKLAANREGGQECVTDYHEDAAAEEERSVGGGGDGGEVAEELRPANETGFPLPTMALLHREEFAGETAAKFEGSDTRMPQARVKAKEKAEHLLIRVAAESRRQWTRVMSRIRGPVDAEERWVFHRPLPHAEHGHACMPALPTSSVTFLAAHRPPSWSVAFSLTLAGSPLPSPCR